MQSIIKLAQRFSQQHKKQRKAFASLDNNDIQYFKSIMSQRSVVTDSDQIEPHNIMFRGSTKGLSKLLLCPHNTQQVSRILRYCNHKKLAVVPQGGNTGLVGGSVPVFDEIIINMQYMDKIEKFDPVSSVVSVQAGVILEKLTHFLQQQGYETPLDLGAKGSCQIGGNASTNAGGKYVLKYGSFRSHILGLEAVLPSGQILDMRSQILKDNTGFDLKQLFIGGEGTLGIITKLNIHCPKADLVKKLMVFKAESYEDIVKSVPKIKSILGKHLNAMECLDEVAYRTVTSIHPPIFDRVRPHEYLLFVEASTQNLQQIFGLLGEYFNDGIMSNNQKEFNKIWQIREDVSIAAKQKGKVVAYDLSYDVKEWANLVGELRKSIKAEVMGYGHIGDGNIHVNMIMKDGQEAPDRKVFEEVVKRKGSISAEHGLGLHKAPFLALQKSSLIIDYYRKIKQLLDPNSIMNPYKYLPQ